ncbi:glycosyltransferase family 4 protein [Oryzobacter terrae]|uniref:glycosyltransferase family 4 protein n=1 Tax=Oryzobacter terrae TaxID=1620385 RepID=UPI00366F5A56
MAVVDRMMTGEGRVRPGPGRALLVTSLRRRGMTGVQTHLAEAEQLLQQRYQHVDVVSLDTLLPPRAAVLVLLAHVLSRVPLRAASFLRLRLVGRALDLATAREVRRHRPEVVYAQDTRSAGAALAARRHRSDYAVVMVVHFNESESSELVGLGTLRPNSRAHRALWAYETDVLRRLDGIVFVSEYMRRHVLEEVPEARSVPHTTLRNVLARTTPPPSLPVTGDLVSVGMLVGRKNHAYLLDVLAAARSQGRDHRLTIVGAGPDHRALLEHARDVGVEDLVTFTGRRSDVDAVLRGHRVYVHSATLDNAPYAVIEAFRAGLPVVSSAVGGIPEVVGDTGAGRFWPLDDPEEGAAVLARLLDDPQALAAASEAAARRFATVYDEDVAGDWLGDFLHRVAGDRARDRDRTRDRAGDRAGDRDRDQRPRRADRAA